jgi:predicted Zn-dependent peptidase
MSSRLFQEVREKRGLCYSVFSYGTAYEDVGQLGVYAATSPEHTPELIDVVANVMLSVGRDVTLKEVDRAKAQLKTSLVMNLESASARADQIARQFLAFGEVPTVSTLVNRIELVGAEDVRILAEDVFNGHKPSLSAVGQLSGLSSYADIAARFAAKS